MVCIPVFILLRRDGVKRVVRGAGYFVFAEYKQKWVLFWLIMYGFSCSARSRAQDILELVAGLSDLQ